MADHKHSWDFHEALRRLGVQNPEMVEIRTPIAMTAPTIDFSEGCVKPVGVYKYGLYESQAGVTGQYSIIEMQIRRFTAILGIVQHSAAYRIFTSAAKTSAGGETNVNVYQGFVSDEPGDHVAQNRYAKGSSATARGLAPVFAAPTVPFSTNAIFPLYILPGNWFVTYSFAVNTLHSVTIFWQEYVGQRA